MTMSEMTNHAYKEHCYSAMTSYVVSLSSDLLPTK